MMLGHLMEWFYSGLGGISQTETSVGYQEIIIAPEPVGNVTWAETVYTSVHGEIKCSWKIIESELTIKVTVPFGCRATIIIPCEKPEKITVGKNPLRSSENIKNIKVISMKTKFDILSGSYEFKTPYINLKLHEKK
jgi:hypothetical protein